MKIIIKKIALYLSALLITISLSACGESITAEYDGTYEIYFSQVSYDNGNSTYIDSDSPGELTIKNGKVSFKVNSPKDELEYECEIHKDELEKNENNNIKFSTTQNDEITTHLSITKISDNLTEVLLGIDYGTYVDNYFFANDLDKYEEYVEEYVEESVKNQQTYSEYFTDTELIAQIESALNDSIFDRSWNDMDEIRNIKILDYEILSYKEDYVGSYDYYFKNKYQGTFYYRIFVFSKTKVYVDRYLDIEPYQFK